MDAGGESEELARGGKERGEREGARDKKQGREKARRTTGREQITGRGWWS